MFFAAIFSWLNERLFGPASAAYAAGAIVGLLVSLGLVFGPISLPNPVVFLVMILGLLASSRIFSHRLLRYYWWSCTGMATLSLVLCFVPPL